MSTDSHLSPFKNFKDDIPASIVVFLVAMPLCLAIALASGAPLFSGIISGIIGGAVVGSLSGSPLGVSGPAAGLAAIVASAIISLGSFEIFLVAVILAGAIQLVMGFLKAGIIAHFFPSSVIHGMLAGIGIIIFKKQIPHALGVPKSFKGGFSEMFNNTSTGAILIAVVSLVILIAWETKFLKSLKFTKLVQGPLVAVTVGIVLNLVFTKMPDWKIASELLVSIPVSEDISGFFKNFAFPDFSALSNPAVYKIAVVLAVVASLETLLCVEASDKQDTYKRVTPTNRELKAQGIGNMLAGFIGGLPVTQVIVRSSANQQSGGKTKASTVLHGIFLLVSVILIPKVLNLIPLAVLAGILFVVGYKLAKPALFKKMYQDGMGQFIPFIITVLGIVFTDLLVGIMLGLNVAIFIILKNNYKIPFKLEKENLEGKDKITIHLSNDVTFLNKAALQKALAGLPDHTHVKIDATDNHFIHHDIIEIIEDFKLAAEFRNIEVTVLNLYTDYVELPDPHFNLANNGGKN